MLNKYETLNTHHIISVHQKAKSFIINLPHPCPALPMPFDRLLEAPFFPFFYECVAGKSICAVYKKALFWCFELLLPHSSFATFKAKGRNRTRERVIWVFDFSRVFPIMMIEAFVNFCLALMGRLFSPPFFLGFISIFGK